MGRGDKAGGVDHAGSGIALEHVRRAGIEAERQTFADLERQCPGARFRLIDEQDGIRQHIRIIVGTEPVRTIDAPVDPADEVHILGALSGG